ncbi:hypothetical protein GCM10028801_31030 [Nocardioides maradonensis]
MSHLVMTGPIKGDVVLSDGTSVDVTPSVIEVASLAIAEEVADLIGKRHAAEGHPDVEGTFRYEGA